MNHRSFLLLALVCVGCAPAGPEQPPTWDEFVAQVHVEPESGLYVVNGDETMQTVDQLAAFYRQMVANWESDSKVGESAQELIVDRIGERDNKWGAASAASLSYCVSRSSFGIAYSTVVKAMASATADWSATANVQFEHRANQDGKCDASNRNVMFDVRQTFDLDYLAIAFRPSYERKSRSVLISITSYNPFRQLTLTGILRHEIGHTLGFRHEHTRPESKDCFENRSWRPLTSYDGASVMHYPHCNGTNTGDLELTARDKAGARKLYP